MVTNWSAGHGSEGVPGAAPDTVLGSSQATEWPPDVVADLQDLASQHAAMQPEGVLGRRVGAAVIDIALLTGLFAILGLIVGQTSPAMEPFSAFLSLDSISAGGRVLNISLSGAWLALYVALLLSYYFTLEAWLGQTVGKRLLGLRVVRADGGRASVRAIAGRTLLRLVDWLPALYLAGFITVLATGHRRRRLGDLAAGTAVARALPARRRGLALVPVAVVLAVAGLSVYRLSPAGGTQTYQAHGVSFDYPWGWQEISVQSVAAVGIPPRWSTAVGLGDQVDLIKVEAYRLNGSVGTGELGMVAPQLERLVRLSLSRLGGVMQAGPQEVTLGGMPGLRFRGTGTIQGIPTELTTVFAFEGAMEYTITCQYTRADAAEVEAACGQVLRTFKVPFSAGGTQAYRAHGVSFDYPAGWQRGGVSSNLVAGRVRHKLWDAAVATDQTHWIDVAVYRLNPPAPTIGSGPLPPAAKSLFQRLFEHLGGSLLANPERITMGGMRGILARGTRMDHSIPVEDTLVFAFHGTTEYVLICEHGRQGSTEVVQACGQVIRTFKIGNQAIRTLNVGKPAQRPKGSLVHQFAVSQLRIAANRVGRGDKSMR